MDKEEIKKMLKKELDEKIEMFVDELIEDLNKDEFDLSKLENSIGNSINNYQNILMKTTERILNSKSEKELISKKKVNFKKKVTD